MKGRRTHTTAALSLLVALLAAGAGAQNPPKREEIPEELAALVRDRWETIELEASGLPDGEWAGSYSSLDGPTISTTLAWSPASGFIVWWNNCSRPWTARVNYGGAVFGEGTLKLQPVLTEGSPSSYSVAAEFVPVKWGGQHFLIPSDKMVNFAYAVNSTSAQQVESFLLKAGDNEKEREGLPDLPPAYVKYLGMEPITASVCGIGPKDRRWYPRLILDAGRAEGVVPDMVFYLSRPRNIYMRVEVLDVQEHMSEAFVTTASFADDREEEIKPEVGWKFTSRAPEDDAQYLP